MPGHRGGGTGLRTAGDEVTKENYPFVHTECPATVDGSSRPFVTAADSLTGKSVATQGHKTPNTLAADLKARPVTGQPWWPSKVTCLLCGGAGDTELGPQGLTTLNPRPRPRGQERAVVTDPQVICPPRPSSIATSRSSPLRPPLLVSLCRSRCGAARG